MKIVNIIVSMKILVKELASVWFQTIDNENTSEGVCVCLNLFNFIKRNFFKRPPKWDTFTILFLKESLARQNARFTIDTSSDFG